MVFARIVGSSSLLYIVMVVFLFGAIALEFMFVENVKCGFIDNNLIRTNHSSHHEKA